MAHEGEKKAYEAVGFAQFAPGYKQVVVDGKRAVAAIGNEALLAQSPAAVTDSKAIEGVLLVADGDDLYIVMSVTSNKAAAEAYQDSFALVAPGPS